MTGERALLLDTHAAIWLVEGRLGEAALDAVVSASLAEGVFVSPVSAWEIGLLARARADRPPLLTFMPDPQRWFASLLEKPIISELALTATAAIAQASLPGELHGDPADRLLIAIARERNIALMTSDRKILAYSELGHVRTVRC